MRLVRNACAVCCLTAVASLGCRLVLDVEGTESVGPSGAGGYASATGSGASGGSGGGTGGFCVGSDSDENNCGSCGHSCLGGKCIGGECQAITIFSSTSSCAYSIFPASDGYLY